MKRRDEVLVGITATIAIIALVIGSLWLARGGLQRGYPLFAKFTWGAGLKQGQPVLLAGVNVGYVESVALRTDGTLIVKMRVRNDYHVPLGTTATIEPNGFFGDQLVALHPTRPNPNTFQPNDTLLSGRPTPQIGDVLARLDTVMGHVSAISQKLRAELVDRDGIADLHQAVNSAHALIVQLTDVARRQSDELSRTQAAMRRAASAIDSSRIDSTLRSFAGAASSVSALTSDLRETTGKLNATLARLNAGPGTASQLLNDPKLYDDVRSLVTRLDSLTADFKKNPRKYIKLSIF